MAIGRVTIRATLEDGADVLHEVFPHLPARDDAAVWDSFAAMSEYCQTLPVAFGIEARKEGHGESGTVRIQDNAKAYFFRGTSKEARALIPGFIVGFSDDESVQRLAEKLVLVANEKGLDVCVSQELAIRPPESRTQEIQTLFDQNPDTPLAAIAAQTGVSESRVYQVIGRQRRTRKAAEWLQKEESRSTETSAEVSPIDQMISDLEKELAALKAIRDIGTNSEVGKRLLAALLDVG